MPTYEYLCDTCEERFTVFMSIKDDHDAPIKEGCPDCKEPDKNNCKIRRLVTGGVGFIRKGSGWTESTSQTKEKHAKLNKLRQDSHMNDEAM